MINIVKLLGTIWLAKTEAVYPDITRFNHLYGNHVGELPSDRTRIYPPNDPDINANDHLYRNKPTHQPTSIIPNGNYHNPKHGGSGINQHTHIGTDSTYTPQFFQYEPSSTLLEKNDCYEGRSTIICSYEPPRTLLEKNDCYEERSTIICS